MVSERSKDRGNRNRIEETNRKLLLPLAAQLLAKCDASQFNQQEMQLRRETADLPGFKSAVREGKEKRERERSG